MLDSFLFTGATMSAPEIVIPGQGQAAVFSCPSPIKESGNEDSAAIFSLDNETTILVVADGMGGLANGADASALLVNSLAQGFSTVSGDEYATREIILNSIEQVNTQLLESNSSGGSTVAIAEIFGNTIRAYHVGDSEIIVTGQKGKLKLQTLSHSPTAYAMESGMIGEEQAINHEDRHFIFNFLGHEDMHIDIGTPVLMNTNDTVLIGTDGLFDNLYSQEIIDIARKGPIEQSSMQLAGLATARMKNYASESTTPSKPDDISFILYRRKPAT